MLKAVSSANRWHFFKIYLAVVDNQLVGIFRIVWEINLGQGTISSQLCTGHIISSVFLHHWVFNLSTLYALHKGGLLQDDHYSACVL